MSTPNNNNTINTYTRPSRIAAREGEAARRITDSNNRQIDAAIVVGMGNADPVYTARGTVRDEYLGITRR
jgi:hypothetical protein